MDRDTVLKRLRLKEAQLRALGVTRLWLYGSVARCEERPDSDVDLAAEIDCLEAAGAAQKLVQEKLWQVLQVPVDLVTEPIEDEAFRKEVHQDRIAIF